MVKIMFIIGFALSLIGAAIIFQGNIFGDRTVSIATILGIVGICFITRYSNNNFKNWWKNE
jgi:hypothetical protein